MTTGTRNDHSAPPTDPVLPSARTLAKGLAVLRIFMGSVLLLNGLAKLLDFRSVEIGPYVANLIDRDATRSILQFEVFENEAGGQAGTGLPLVRPVAQFVLDNFGFFQWAVTATEIVVGLLLVLGLASRAAALVALGFALTLAVIYASSDRWMFEQPLEYVPYLILSIVPSGRVWGLDGKVLRRRGTSPSELHRRGTSPSEPRHRDTSTTEFRGWPSSPRPTHTRGDRATLTPADVEATTFRTAMRGYNMTEVDTFLDRVASDLGRLLSEDSTQREPTHTRGDRATLTPADVEATTFRTAMRGYNMTEVDTYLDRVASDLGRLLSEDSTQREQF
jgi:DivIVA domain-containing protein